MKPIELGYNRSVELTKAQSKLMKHVLNSLRNWLAGKTPVQSGFSVDIAASKRRAAVRLIVEWRWKYTFRLRILQCGAEDIVVTVQSDARRSHQWYLATFGDNGNESCLTCAGKECLVTSARGADLYFTLPFMALLADTAPYEPGSSIKDPRDGGARIPDWRWPARSDLEKWPTRPDFGNEGFPRT